MTDKLEEMNTCDSHENLLSTIRCPRDLGMISNRLPKPQYNSLQRSSSQDIREEKNALKPIPPPCGQITSSVSTPRVATHSQNGRPKRGARECGSLPTIAEDSDNDDYGSRSRRPPMHNKPVSSQVKYRQHQLALQKRSEVVRHSQDYS